MSRFKVIVDSSSDSDEQVLSGNVQRGRIRQTKRFTQIQTKNIQQQDTAQIIIQKKQKPKKQKIKNIQKSLNQKELSLQIQVNQYKQISSVNGNQKFIREHIKPVQDQLIHYLDKMQLTIKDRKKFTNALSTCSKDLQKVTKKIIELKSQQLQNKHSLQNKNSCNGEQKYKAHNIEGKLKLKTMQQLQSKIRIHLCKVMRQHEKTIQLLIQNRKDMQRVFMRVKYMFLDLAGLQFYKQQTYQYEEYGIIKVYKILQLADAIINQITSFNK